MSVAETIRAKLVAAFQPDQLEIVDQSDLHRGHAGARPEGETHFKVSIVSSRFEGMNRVYAKRFGSHRPARTTVAVRANPKAALVEIECIAAAR